MALLAGGGSAQLVRSVGSAGSVQGFQAGGELAGARLSAALPFTAGLLAQDGIAQQAQGVAGITGNLAATESGADTAALAGVVLVQGALAATEAGADTLSAEGVVRIAGTLAATESGADTFAATGGTSSSITGTLAATETGGDTFSAEGIVKVQGGMAAQEVAPDTFAATGQVLVQGALAATEAGADSFSAVGEVGYGAPPSAIWGYTLSNGLTAGQTLVELHAMLRELHQLHGLEMGSPLVVSATQRTVAAIVQGVGEIAGTVTVTRH